CEEPGGHELDERDDARGSRAAVAVCVDQRRDPHRPLGAVERSECELDAAQLAVAEDGREDTAALRRQRSGRRSCAVLVISASIEGNLRMTVGSAPAGKTTNRAGSRATTLARRG